MGLVAAVVADPVAAARAYYDEYLAPLSASSLRYAVRAARIDFVDRVRERLEAVEKLYLRELMSSRDPEEGLRSFLAKRVPQWTDS